MASRIFGAACASAVVAAALLCGLPGSAEAQGIANSGSFSGLPGQPPPFSKEQLDRSMRTGRMPPPALPGAAVKGAISPPTKVPKLLSPTDELFDAINRGDVAAARDALSRGAQLDAQDELGMTPLQLSVDLGRSPITFLLLSMRGSNSGAQAPAAIAQGANGSGIKSAATQPPARRRTRVRDVSAQSTGPAEGGGQQTLPKLFTEDGGHPIPQAGFLGFGGR